MLVAFFEDIMNCKLELNSHPLYSSELPVDSTFSLEPVDIHSPIHSSLSALIPSSSSYHSGLKFCLKSLLHASKTLHTASDASKVSENLDNASFLNCQYKKSQDLDLSIHTSKSALGNPIALTESKEILVPGLSPPKCMGEIESPPKWVYPPYSSSAHTCVYEDSLMHSSWCSNEYLSLNPYATCDYHYSCRCASKPQCIQNCLEFDKEESNSLNELFEIQASEKQPDEDLDLSRKLSADMIVEQENLEILNHQSYEQIDNSSIFSLSSPFPEYNQRLNDIERKSEEENRPNILSKNRDEDVFSLDNSEVRHEMDYNGTIVAALDRNNHGDVGINHPFNQHTGNKKLEHSQVYSNHRMTLDNIQDYQLNRGRTVDHFERVPNPDKHKSIPCDSFINQENNLVEKNTSQLSLSNITDKVARRLNCEKMNNAFEPASRPPKSCPSSDLDLEITKAKLRSLMPVDIPADLLISISSEEYIAYVNYLKRSDRSWNSAQEQAFKAQKRRIKNRESAQNSRLRRNENVVELKSKIRDLVIQRDEFKQKISDLNALLEKKDREIEQLKNVTKKRKISETKEKITYRKNYIGNCHTCPDTSNNAVIHQYCTKQEHVSTSSNRMVNTKHNDTPKRKYSSCLDFQLRPSKFLELSMFFCLVLLTSRISTIRRL
ncbi:uncharacterized protein LOC126325836 [Schistocerca gregaria]|uniref:uncharacterized protein LOC126325836 n=1 Tax=Schistocerca gregaria TaxID=7010 RepID=UPI00211F00A9|nr:uncharacterized protein LOC126325836 [Schistocerca gregaria]